MIYLNNSNSINEEIEYICKLLYNTLNIPIYFIDNKNNFIFSISYKHTDNPLINDKKSLFLSLFDGCNSYDFPILKSTKYHENYFAINLLRNDVFLGMFVIGPSLYSEISSESINKIIFENEISLTYKKDLINYFNSISIMDYSSLINSSLLFYYSIYNKKLDINKVIEKNSSLENIVSKIKQDNQNIVSNNRQNLFFHHTPNREKNISQCIRDGSKENLLKCISVPEDGKYGILSDNPLRSQKNFFICCVSIATRAAMEGGLDSELAYSLSDSYIQNVEYINNANDLFNLETKMFCDFADNVLKSKKIKYSKPILDCQSYISKHLYQEISLSELSDLVGLSPKYLSSLFIKEVGTNLSTYIQEKRIEEAKHLLNFSNYSILDIASWLGFHDQSHFTRIFKKLTGTTPKKFRSK